MPGLVGFTRGAEGGGECAARLDAMARLVTHRGFHRRDADVCTPLACGTRVHTGILQPDAQPGGRDGVSVWLDGELFHLPGEGGRGHAAAFAAMYAADPGMGFLRGLDGIYAAVVLDAPR
ncbi:MAG TPA: hypothetical protein VFH27_02195, partial [Longimicrobiaceae bacterium]|nr:hypothetical protein [Longimicrobiaceae bacterium]